ncbi:MAG: glycosyltransferase family 39 protein [Deltaproteobacteria bacterium]|nr:glycosyltransferase family 39 protein [Deltaproteobacteria bacterium]
MLLAVLILVGSFYNLANYPTIWWDEAIFSETAANLVQHGRYAFTVQTPDQLNDLDYRISVGPAVILPVALAYKLLGVSLVTGRLVAGLYLVLAFLGLFLAARRLWSPGAALLAVALALLGTDVFYWGRSVLGDIPALALFLLSAGFLIQGLENRSNWPLFLGGLFLGLAFDAKEFYGLAFLPPLALLIWQSWRERGSLSLKLLAYAAGLALPLLAYLLLKAIILGSLAEAVFHFLHQKKLLCHEFFTPLTIGRIYPESLLYLLEHPLFWLGLAGTVWTWKKEAPGPGARLWILNFLLWCLIYLTAVWWQRFALPALFLAAPLAAHFLLQGIGRLTAHLPHRSAWVSGGVVLAFLIGLYPWSGLDYLNQVLTRGNNPPEKLVKFLRAHVPDSWLIETPEYELAFLDNEHRIHLMPSFYFVESTPKQIVLFNPRPYPYNFERMGANVLILGNFGKGVFQQIYPPRLVARDWRRIAQVDYYDIYVRQAKAPALITRSGKTRAIKATAATPKVSFTSH